MDDSLFRQKPANQIPRGQEQQAVDANPSPQPARIGTPVWRSFVANKEFQENNKAAIAAEQQQMRESRRETAQPIFKGAAGKLIRKVGRMTEELNPEEWANDPVAGPEARKSLWDGEIRTLKKQASDDSFQLRDPAFQSKILSDKDRAAKLSEGSVLQESDPTHQKLKAELMADEEARQTRTTLAQRAFDAEKRARELEGVHPDDWWQSRTAPKPSEQRAAVVAQAQAERADAAAAENDAATRAREIDAELQSGVTGERSRQLLTEKAEIAAGRGKIAEVAAKAEEPIKAEQEKARGFLGNEIAAVKRGYAGAAQAANILQGATDATNASDIARYEAMKEANPQSKEFTEFMKAEGFWESAKAFAKNPVQIVTEVMLESAAQMVPSLVLGAAGGAAGGALTSTATGGAAAPATVPVGAVVGSAIGAGSGSFLAEYGGSMMEAMQEAGMDAKNPESIQQFFADPAKLEKAREFAVKRGVAVGVFDAVSAGLAGKFMKPVQALAKSGQKVGTGAVLAATGKEIGAQAAAGATGEAAGQLASRGEIQDGKSIFLEGVAEVASAPVEVATNLREFSKPIAADPVEVVAAELATIDPEAAPPAPEEVAAAKMIAPDAPAEGVLIERELAAIEAEDKASYDAADAAVAEAVATGDTKAVKAAEEARDNLPLRARTVRAVLKIAAGKQLDDLTAAELSSIGAKEENGGFEPMTDEELKKAGLTKHLIRDGADGSIILRDEALDAVKDISPRARSLVKMTEDEALKKAKERTMSEWDVPMRDGSMQRVRANSPEMAEREAAAVAPVSGQGAVQVFQDEQAPQANNSPESLEAAVGQGEEPPASLVSPAPAGNPPAATTDAVVPDIEAADTAATAAKIEELNGKGLVVQAVREAEALEKRRKERAAAVAPTDKESLTVAPALPAPSPQDWKSRDKFVGEDFAGPANTVVIQPRDADSNPVGDPITLPLQDSMEATADMVASGFTQAIGGGSWRESLVKVIGPDGKAIAQMRYNADTGKMEVAEQGKLDAARETLKQKQAAPAAKPKASPAPTANLAETGSNLATTRATIRAKATIAKLKKNKRINIEEVTGATQAVPGKIQVNAAAIIKKALEKGMTDEQAGQYFDMVMDEEVRHLAQFDAAETLWKLAKSPGNFDAWMHAHYATIWQNDFVATGKADDVRDSYGMLDQGVRPDWKSLPDWQKAMEGIRIMSQTNPTENAKLWLNISDTLKQAIRAALASLKKFRTPALETEIANLENALRQLTDTNPDSKKPTASKAGDGNRKPTKTGGDSKPSGNGEAIPPRRDGAGPPVVVGSRVEFERDGKRLTGTVVNPVTATAARVRPDNDPAISFGVLFADMRVIDAKPAATTPDYFPVIYNEFNAATNEPAGDTHEIRSASSDIMDGNYFWVRKDLDQNEFLDRLDDEKAAEFAARKKAAKVPSLEAIKAVSDEYLAAVGRKAFQGDNPIDKAFYKMTSTSLDRIFSGETFFDAYRRQMEEYDDAGTAAVLEWTLARLEGKKAKFPVAAETNPNNETKPEKPLISGEEIKAPATITFPSRAEAQEFAKAWGRFSLRGHDLSSTKSDGTTSVTVYDVTPEERQWIDSQSAAPTGQSEGEVAQPTLDQLNDPVWHAQGLIDEIDQWVSELTNNGKRKINDVFGPSEESRRVKMYLDRGGRIRSYALNTKAFGAEASFRIAINKARTFAELRKAAEKLLSKRKAEAEGKAFSEKAKPTLSEADQALLDAMEGLYTSPLTESFTDSVPPDRIGPLVNVATKYLADGVSTPEALAERLKVLADGRMRRFSQSIWFAFKMAGVDGVDRPDWKGIYSKDESGLPVGEGDSGAGTGEPSATPQEAPKKVKRRRRNTGSRILDAFTNNPFVMAILQNGGMMSKARAKSEMGNEWWELNGSQYDDAPVFKNPTFNVIYSKTSSRTPNKLADDIALAGLMPDGDINRMWSELRKAADSASRVNVEMGKEIKKSERQFAQTEAFEAANQEQVSGVMGVQVGDQEEGMTFTIAGEEFTVESNDGETVVIRDGEKFGTQTLSAADAVWIEIAEDSDFLSQDEIDVAAESIVDIVEAKGYASVDELAEAEPEAIQAEIQGSLDESGPDGGAVGGSSPETSEDFTLSTYQTDDERRAEEAAAKVKEEIRKRQEKRLIGEAGDLTADMFGGGETPLFNEVRSTPAKPKDAVLWGRGPASNGEWIKLTSNTSKSEIARREKDGWETLVRTDGSSPAEILQAPAKPLTTLNFLAGTPLEISSMSMEEAVQERVKSIIPGWSGTVREARTGDPDTMLGVFDAGRNEIRINYDRFRYFRDELGLSEADVSEGVLTTLSHEIIHAAENDVLKEIYAAETGTKPAFDQWAKDYRKSVMDSMVKDSGLRNAAAAYVAKMPKAMQKDMLRDASRLSPEITRMFIEQQILGKTSEEQSIKSRQGDAQSRPWLSFMDRTLGKIREWLGKSPSRPMADLIDQTKKQLEKYRIKPEQIPNLPPFAAEAVAQAESARILGDLNAETLGEGARNITGLADVRSPDTVAKARAAADQNGWAWPDVLEVVRKQLGLNDDFVKDGTELDKLIKAKRKDAEKLREAGAPANINPPIIQQLNREIDRAKLVYGGLTEERLNRAIIDAAWSLAGDSQTLRRQDAMEFLTGARPPKAKAGVNNIAAELKKWVGKNPVETVEVPAETPKPRKPKTPPFLDLLENYFQPGKVVEAYGGGQDRVIAFKRGEDERWAVTVQSLDDDRGPRSHSTAPSDKELMKAWEETQQGIGSSNSGQYPTPSPSTGGKTPSAKAESEVQILPDSPTETKIDRINRHIKTIEYRISQRGTSDLVKKQNAARLAELKEELRAAMEDQTQTAPQNTAESAKAPQVAREMADLVKNIAKMTKILDGTHKVGLTRAQATTQAARGGNAAKMRDSYKRLLANMARAELAAGREIPRDVREAAGSSLEYDEKGEYAPIEAKKPEVPFEALEALELVRDFRGTWQYKMRVGGTWYTANDRDGAIEGAVSAYKSTPEAERKTRQQLDAEADAAYDAKGEELFGGKSKAELEKQLSDIERDIAKLQSAGRNEFTGQGTRRTGAATSNEAARGLGETKMRLERYLREKFPASKEESLPEGVSQEVIDGMDRDIARAQDRFDKLQGIQNRLHEQSRETPGSFTTGRSNQHKGLLKARGALNDRMSKAFDMLQEAEGKLKQLKERRAGYASGEFHENGQPRANSPSRKEGAKAVASYGDYLRATVKKGDRITFVSNQAPGGSIVKSVNKNTITVEGGTSWSFDYFMPWKDGKEMTKAELREDLKAWREGVEEADGAINSLESAFTFLDGINAGTVTADQIKAAWQSFKDNERLILADLSKMTMKQLERFQGMRRPDNKAQAVRAALDFVTRGFNPNDSLSFQIIGDMKAAMLKAMDEAVATWTDERVAQKAQAFREARERRAKKAESAKPEGTLPAPRDYPSFQENEERWKKEGKEREAAELAETAVQTTADIETFSPEQAASELAKRGITVEKGTTKTGKPVWEIKGKTFDVKDTLKSMGAKWYNPKKSWSIYSDEDPTTKIANALAGKSTEGASSAPAQNNAGTGRNADEELRLRELRERLDATPDGRGTRGDAIASVNASTAALIRKGLDFGMPPDVVEDQIEDIAMISRAFDAGKPMFLLGNGAGTGKTFVLGGAIHELRAKGTKSFVYVTMNQDLIDQIKNDLREYGVSDVSFHTYSELSTKGFGLPPDSVLVFDESHNVKNADSSRGSKTQPLMGSAKFTIIASATPFENPVEAAYLAGTGVFNEAGGHTQWGKAYGASVRKYKAMTPEGLKEFETLYWQNGKLEDGLAARQWFVRQGIMVTRPMRLPMEMVESQFSKRPAEAKWVKMYNEVEQAYESAMANYRDEDGNILDARNNAMVAMHMTNTIKRILEASKVNHAVEDANKILADGGNVVIFVETKADRWIGKYRASELYQKNSPLYTYPEMREMHREWEMEKNMAYKMGERPGPRPFAEAILEIARAMHDAKIMIELPSVEQEVVEKLGGPSKVGVYTGSVTNAKARADKDAFLAGKKKVIVATMAKGGTGLSLHDKVGNRPTFQININLPWKATGVDQVSGRVARYGLQSKAFINWLFADNIPFERSLASRVGRRMRDMGALVKGIDMKAAKVLSGDFDFEGSVDVKQDSGEVEVAEQDIFEQAERLEKSRRQRGDQSNGFFETPFPLAALMTQISGSSGKLLDPSAGRGNLIRFAKDQKRLRSITAVELRSDNADYLEGMTRDMDGAVNQGNRMTVKRGDFMELANSLGLFNTIHMNPPFERKAGVGWQDMAHVMTAFSMLTPDGRLVAIVGEGGFFRQDKQSEEFRRFLSDKGAVVIKLPEGAFKNSGTGVRTRMIVLDQNADAGRTDIDLSDMDADSLRSVAEAIPSRDGEIGLQTSPLSSQDSDYLAAVSRGDMETAQRMVDEAADKAGYTVTGYHAGTVAGITEFKPLTHFGSDIRQLEGIKNRRNALKEKPADSQYKVFLNLQNPKRVDDTWNWKDRMTEAIAESHDGLVYKNYGEGFNTEEGATFKDSYIPANPNQIKSADPVTYDKSGKPIPLSQRFNPESDSILYTSPLSEENDTFKRRIKVDPALTTNSKEQQALFGKNVASGKLAGFGNRESRLEQDVVDAEYEFRKVVKTNADAARAARARLKENPEEIENKLLRMAMGEDVQTDAADQLAFQYLIDQKSAAAGDNAAKHADNAKLRMAYRLQRGDIARELQIGYDRSMSPEERAQAALTEAIYTPSRKVQEYAKKLSGKKRLDYLAEESAKRIAEVEERLKKMNTTLAQVTGKNQKLQLENTRLGKELLKTRNVMEADIIKAVRNGWTMPDIQRRWGKLGAEQAMPIITKARQELYDRISEMSKSGMTRDQILEKIKQGLATSPLGASNGMTPEEIWGMIENDLGIPAVIPTTRPTTSKPKPQKTPKAPNVNQFTANWSRPDFTDGLKAYTFDTKDREGIMERVEIIRGLAGAVGKIDALTGGQRTQALRKLQEINAILAKYGTDATEIFNSSKGIEDYRFDMSDIAQVAAVSRAISMMDADIVDKASEWLYFSMLSGLQTMLVNATAIVPAAWESTVGKGVEMAINSVIRNPMGAQLGEEKYVLRALGPAITRAMSNARTAFAAQHPMFDRDVMAQEVDWERIMGGKGYRVGGSISGKWGDRIRVPMRILSATDDFNTTLMACCEVGAFAYRVGVSKGMKPGSAELDKFIRQEVNTPGSFSYQLAAVRAKNAIFSNPLPGQTDPVTGKKVPVSDIGDAVGYVAGKITETFAKEHDNLFVKSFFAAMRISFFPFQRTPFNILRKGIRYTLNPFSMFDIALGVTRNARNDGKWDWKITGDDAIAMERRMERANLITRAGMQLQGGMLMLLVAGLGEGDEDDQDKPLVITGSAPFTPRGMAERQTAMDSGMGPYRISFRRADGSERFGFNYGRIEPMATTLAASIDIMKQIKRADRSGKDIEGVAAAALGGFVAQAQDKSFLRGIGDLISLSTNAIAEPDLKENRKIQQFVASRVAMAVPNIIKQPIRELDSNFRERSESFMEELLYQVAPAGQKSASVNPFGETVEKTGNPVARIIDVTDAGTNKVNPIASMLLRYRDKRPDKAWFPSAIRNASYKDPRTGKEVEMTADQLAEFRSLAGRRATALLKSLKLNTSNPTERDIEMVKKAFTDSRSAVKKALVAKYSR